MYARILLAVLIVSSPAYGDVTLERFFHSAGASINPGQPSALLDRSGDLIGSMDGSYSEYRSVSSSVATATTEHRFTIALAQGTFLGNNNSRAFASQTQNTTTSADANSTVSIVFNVDSSSKYTFQAAGSKSPPVDASFAVVNTQFGNMSNQFRPISAFTPPSTGMMTTHTARGVIFPGQYFVASFTDAQSQGFMDDRLAYGDDDIRASIDFNLRIKTLTCAEVIDGAVAMPTKLPASGLPEAAIYTKFVPNFGLTIVQAAEICKVGTFNWVNQVVTVPDHWTVRRFFNDADPRSGDDVTPRPGRPLFDPVLQAAPNLVGHYQFFSPRVQPEGVRIIEVGPRDNLVFYLNEPSDSFFGCTLGNPVRTASYLEFCDRPAMPDILLQNGEQLRFRTQLAGVGVNGEWVHLPPTKQPTGFDWATNVQCRPDQTCFGEIRLQVADDGALIDGISGSIFDIQTTNESYYIPGDANLDGAVDRADAAIVASNFGALDTFWQDGDFDFGRHDHPCRRSALAIASWRVAARCRCDPRACERRTWRHRIGVHRFRPPLAAK